MDYTSTKEAAEILSLTPEYVANLCQKGLLEARKPGREWWVNKASILDYKARQDRGEIKRRGKRKGRQ